MSDKENLYNCQRWRKERAAFLNTNPFCIYCQEQGRLKIADVVDHKVPHRGNLDLFWDPDNWQGLCYTHHNAIKATEENKGIAAGCGLNGMPLDKKHPWKNDC